ncbi:hypothetical protein VCV18_010102 [Metarhizium anisopliae]
MAGRLSSLSTLSTLSTLEERAGARAGDEGGLAGSRVEGRAGLDGIGWTRQEQEQLWAILKKVNLPHITFVQVAVGSRLYISTFFRPRCHERFSLKLSTTALSGLWQCLPRYLSTGSQHEESGLLVDRLDQVQATCTEYSDRHELTTETRLHVQ